MTSESSDESLPPEIDNIAIPLTLDTLAPWHRPRKQHVREYQWARYAKEFRDRQSRKGASKTLRYLTLPGVDFFDVEVIHNAIAESGHQIELTAFQSQANNRAIQARCHVRMESLIRRGAILDTAVVLPYSIEEIENTNSQAFISLSRRGPFDIVNLDACGSIAAPSKANKLIRAIHRIVEFQHSRLRQRWLLFITADMRKEDTCPDILEQLVAAITMNRRSDSNFENHFTNKCKEIGIKSERDVLNKNVTRDIFLKQIALGLSKWIIHLADESDFCVNSKIHYCYGTEGKDGSGPSMASLAYEFIPNMTPLNDRLNIGRASLPQTVQENYHLKALNSIFEMVDLDEELKDIDRRTSLAKSQLVLLRQAGYTEEALAQFASMYLTA